jgi:hypothetical protein
MRFHHNPDSAPGAASFATERDDDDERRVLLELVTDPPPGGEDRAALSARLGLPRRRVVTALARLSAAGLVDVTGDLVRPTAAARRFDALWPIRP